VWWWKGRLTLSLVGLSRGEPTKPIYILKRLMDHDEFMRRLVIEVERRGIDPKGKSRLVALLAQPGNILITVWRQTSENLTTGYVVKVEHTTTDGLNCELSDKVDVLDGLLSGLECLGAYFDLELSKETDRNKH
jgi:hypothetical protein